MQSIKEVTERLLGMTYQNSPGLRKEREKVADSYQGHCFGDAVTTANQLRL